jgi:hypothetical protein
MDGDDDRALDDFLTLFAVAAADGEFDPDAVCAAEIGTGPKAAERARRVIAAAQSLRAAGADAVADRVRRRANLHFDEPAEAGAWLAAALAALARRTGQNGSSSVSQ